jgi:phosphate transport system substrate-binding protein
MCKIAACVSCVLALIGGAPGQNSNSVVLVGAGGTLPLPVYAMWFRGYQKAYPNRQVHYMAVGSGEGIHQVTSGTIDFGGSDLPMTDREMSASQVKVRHFPTLLGAVVPVYNVPGLEKPLNFTPEILAGIFLGGIQRWNHPAIALANPGVTLPANEIAVVHRMEASGTTYVWTDYLSKVNVKWRTQIGKGAEVKWPTGIAARGNGGAVDTVKQTPYSIGYCELSYALRSPVSYGLVQNASGKFIRADPKSITAAAAGAEFGSRADFRASITNPLGSDAYPIATFTWLLVPELKGNKRIALNGLLLWMLTTGQSPEVESLGYGRLPYTVVVRELDVLARNQ